MPSLVHIPAGAGSSIDLNGFVTTLKVPSAATNGALAIVEHTLAPGLLGAPLHCHTREDETSYVLAGTLTTRIGDETLTVDAGGYVVKPRGVPHTFWNAGPAVVHFVEVITPGGFETYFEALAAHLTADGLPDLSALAALAARYGMTFDFATLPALMQQYGLRLEA